MAKAEGLFRSALSVRSLVALSQAGRTGLSLRELARCLRKADSSAQAAVAIERQDRDFPVAHPEIPWRQVQATRHRIVHGYEKVDHEVIRGMVEIHLPAHAPDRPDARSGRPVGDPRRASEPGRAVAGGYFKVWYPISMAWLAIVHP